MFRLLLLAFLPFLIACSSLDGLLDSVDRPTASVTDVRLVNLAPDGVTLSFDMNVANPYDVPIPLMAVDYGLASRDTPFLQGQADLTGSVPARGSRTVTLPARVEFTPLLQTLNTVRPGQVIPYDAQIGLTVDTPVNQGGMRIPIATDGEFPVPDVPRIAVESVNWEELNLSQAIATLKLRVANPNEFPVILDSLTTNLQVAGTTIATTDIGNAIAFEPNGVQTLDLPITFSPLDAGVGIFNMLRRSDTSYDATGSLRLVTPFGPVDMGY